MARSADIARSARYSCAKPMIALSTTMTAIALASRISPSAALRMHAPSKSQIIAPENCPANMRSGLGPRA